MSENNYLVYLLINTHNKCTYVGITNNLQRRIRQHNGDLVGGAKYTKMKKAEGIWEIFGTITNLTKSQALSLEKKIHIRTKKTKGSTPLDKRLNCIAGLLENNETNFCIYQV
jgi:predicted GIY-YIG superfamily endonuclease